MKAMTESQLEQKCVAHAKKHGMLSYKFSSPAHRGVPDRIFIAKGRVFFVEFKRPGTLKKKKPKKGKPTLQQKTIDDIRKAGVDVWQLDSYDDFKDIVQYHENPQLREGLSLL
jgi:hypothetical protein